MLLDGQFEQLHVDGISLRNNTMPFSGEAAWLDSVMYQLHVIYLVTVICQILQLRIVINSACT